MGRPFRTSIVSPYALLARLLRAKQVEYRQDQPAVDSCPNANNGLA